MDKNNFWDQLPEPRGMDPLYFNRKRSLLGALTGRSTDVLRVIDVGANIGNSVDDFLNWFPSCAIVAFEPLPSAFSSLFERRRSEWVSREVYLRPIAVSNDVSLKTLYSSKAQTVNSSFRVPNRTADTIRAHRGLNSNSPSSFELGESDLELIEVPVTTLDHHFSDVRLPEAAWNSPGGGSGIDVLKIDTQSHDFHVLKGAEKLLRRIKCVCLEWIFDDVYGEPVPLHELDSYMQNLGFGLWDISHIYKDIETCRTLWVDLIYINKGNRNFR